MNKPTDTRRTVDEGKYPNRLHVISKACEQKDFNLMNEFSSSDPELEELPASPNLYDKLLKFCCSWNFVFIFLALLSSFVIYSLLRYWFL